MRARWAAFGLMLFCATSALAAGEADWRTPEQILREAKEMECDKARTDLTNAKIACREAVSDCERAIAAERKACISAEEVQTARDIAECTNNAPDPSCYAGARSAGAARIELCRTATYKPDECKVIAGICEQVKTAQTAKDAACK